MVSNKHKTKNNRSKKKSFQIIALKRIDELFGRAYDFLKINKKYSNNCVKLARKISLRYKVPLTKQQKLLFCKNCGAYLHPGITSRVRVSRGKVVVVCLNCKKISRYMYK